MPPVNLQLEASCLNLQDMPSTSLASNNHHHGGIPSGVNNSSVKISSSIKTGHIEPDVSEWSGLLINEQEVAIHPVQAVDSACMASSANSIELTPLWPKNGSPNHCNRGGWPSDHKNSTLKGGQRAPPPPPPPSLGPPAVPTKSKNQPAPTPPPLPVTSSREFLLQRKQQELSTRRLHSEERGQQPSFGSENKGPAPQPPSSANPPVTSQPLRPSSSVSRGLQVEEDDLIQFTNGQKVSLSNGTSSTTAAAGLTALSTSTSVAQLKKQLRSRLSLDDDVNDPDLDEEEDDLEETASARTADEQMDYLEGLEPCPCYAKCCLDSIISLFCVTVLG